MIIKELNIKMSNGYKEEAHKRAYTVDEWTYMKKCSYS